MQFQTKFERKKDTSFKVLEEYKQWKQNSNLNLKLVIQLQNIKNSSGDWYKGIIAHP